MDKTKALDAALSQIERAFGKGSIMRLGKGPEVGRDRGDFDRFARPRRLRRRRTCARSGLRPQARRQSRRPADLAARHRRTGARDHRHAGALRRVDVLVVDSVAALTPRAEIEGEMGDASMGLQARLMSQALRKLTASISSQHAWSSSSTRSA